MKSIFATVLAVFMLLSVMGGCARDMSGETRTAPQADATDRPVSSTSPTGAAEGVIEKGKDAMDGVIGAGENAVDDVVGAGEDIIDDVTGAKKNAGGAVKTTEKPQPSPKAAAKH